MAHPAQPSAPVLRVLLALAQLAAARGYNEWTLVAAADRCRARESDSLIYDPLLL